MGNKATLRLSLLLVLFPGTALWAQPPIDWSGPGKWWNHSLGPDTGSATEDLGVLVVKGGGADIYGTSDGFHYVFKQLNGDGSITARVVRIGGPATNEWRKAGVMIRQDLTPGSANVMMEMTPTGGHAWCLQWRTTAGGSTGYTTGGSMALPYWVRLERRGNQFTGYISADGVTWAPQGTPQTVAMNNPVYVGLAVTSHETGRLCEAAFDNVMLTGDVKGSRPDAEAADPIPAVGTTDVPRDAVVRWTAGESAATHDVYFGTSFADVNTASRTTPKGALAGQGQTAATFDPAGLLAFGQVYYWRVDEVEQSGTIHKGSVWSFTSEPYGYPIKPVAATASSAQAGMGPEKTIDGSGLTGDLHGTEGTTMWLSAGAQPNWIQYAFDKAYKLYDLKVWNSNQLIEAILGFGARKVTIETSLDGTTWTALASVPEFAKAPGTPGYAANTTVALGAMEAKYVKLTINSTWGGLGAVTGLSEVRFSYVPVQARAPQPATAATGVKLDVTMDWRSGRGATSHKVYFGTDPNAVAQGTAAAKTVLDHGFTPDTLNYGTTYYWRVDEVNTVTVPGSVWSFTTQEYAAVDDFESYTDKPGAEVFSTWIDGYMNSTGSVVGLTTAVNGTFCETTIVHGGKCSMPYEYNNVKTPFYSEATRTFDTPQNWTGNGADTLSLWFRGRPVAWADKGNNAYAVSGSGADIYGSADQFRFVCKQLSGNGSITVKVDSLVNTHPWARAGIMVRETLEAGSRNALIAVTPGNGIVFQWRDGTNGTTSYTNAGTTGMVPPYWLRITRTGNVIKGERSADGKTWTQQGTDTTVVLATNVYIGLVAASHDAALTTVAEFSNFSTTGTVTGSWQSVAIGMAMPTNDPTPLYLVVEDKTGKKKTVVHANPAASATAAWTQWRIGLSDLSAAGINLAVVKKLTLGVGDPADPKPSAAGMLYLDDIAYGHPAK